MTQRRSKPRGVEGLTIGGLDQMWMLQWDSPARERRFLELAGGEWRALQARRLQLCRRSHTTTTRFETSRLERARALVALRDEEDNQ